MSSGKRSALVTGWEGVNPSWQWERAALLAPAGPSALRSGSASARMESGRQKRGWAVRENWREIREQPICIVGGSGPQAGAAWERREKRREESSC